MKKIEAIIRKTKFEAVKDALHTEGIDFFSYWDVRGHGTARQERVYRGVMYDLSVIERIKLSFVVRDKFLDGAVTAILDAAKTGDVGDGKIFVSNIENSYRIRTGESGDKTLYVDGQE
jgi:nitrogen regulatory protein P-II 1